MNLSDSIRLGESKTLELKARLPQNEQIAKPVVAFANTSGGKFMIGVDDSRQHRFARRFSEYPDG